MSRSFMISQFNVFGQREVIIGSKKIATQYC
jgi:hypothetical protein